jgi:hypothetical protein
MHPTRWQIATLFESQRAQTGHIDSFLIDMNIPCQPKTAQATAPGFVLRVAKFAFPLAFSFQLTAASSFPSLYGGVHYIVYQMVFPLKKNGRIVIEDSQNGLR